MRGVTTLRATAAAARGAAERTQLLPARLNPAPPSVHLTHLIPDYSQAIYVLLIWITHAYFPVV